MEKKEVILKGHHPAAVLLVSSMKVGGSKGIDSMRGLRHMKEPHVMNEIDHERMVKAEAKRLRKLDRKQREFDLQKAKDLRDEYHERMMEAHRRYDGETSYNEK